LARNASARWGRRISSRAPSTPVDAASPASRSPRARYAQARAGSAIYHRIYLNRRHRAATENTETEVGTEITENFKERGSQRGPAPIGGLEAPRDWPGREEQTASCFTAGEVPKACFQKSINEPIFFMVSLFLELDVLTAYWVRGGTVSRSRANLVLIFAVAVLCLVTVGFVSGCGHGSAAKKPHVQGKLASLAGFNLRFAARPVGPGLITMHRAVALARQNSVDAAYSKVRLPVYVRAQYGLFSDDTNSERLPSGRMRLLFQNMPAWIVTFSGPGIRIPPIGGRRRTENVHPMHLRTLKSQESVVMNARTGAFIEDFLKDGLA
jgi:hypothetical protein